MTCTPFLPAEITSGLDFQADFSLSDYPAPAWSLKAVLRGPQAIDLVSTAVGSSHHLAATAATTAAWAPGVYWFSLRALSGARTVELGKGQLHILQDLAAVAGPFDGRTQNEIALEAINAVLAKKATRDQLRYVINNRELWRMRPADLLQLRAFYVTQVRRERQRANGCATFGRAVTVRFSNQ